MQRGKGGRKPGPGTLPVISSTNLLFFEGTRPRPVKQLQYCSSLPVLSSFDTIKYTGRLHLSISLSHSRTHAHAHTRRLKHPSPWRVLSPSEVVVAFAAPFDVVVVSPPHSLLQLPADKLDTAKKQVEYITPAETIKEEEDRLRHAAALMGKGVEREPSTPWFASNVVDHRYIHTYQHRLRLPLCLFCVLVAWRVMRLLEGEG